MFKCDNPGCSFESRDASDFVINADTTICIACVEKMNEELEAAEEAERAQLPPTAPPDEDTDEDENPIPSATPPAPSDGDDEDEQ